MPITRRKVLAGIGTLGAIGGSMTIKRSRAASEPIKIGFIGELTGPSAPVGFPARIGSEVARDHINRNGGVNGRQIELIEMDDAGDPNQAVSEARQFASTGVNLIAGPSTTNTCLAVSSLMPDLKSIGIFMGTPEIRFTHELFNRNIFLTSPNNYTRNRAIAKFMAEHHPNIKIWTGVIPDNAAGHGGWTAFTGAMKDMYPKVAGHDVTFVEPILAKFGTPDYKTQINELLASPATGFWTPLAGADGITFYRQGLQFGISKKFEAMVDYSIDIDLPRTLRRNVPPNIWSSGYWYYGASLDNPMTQEVISAFTKAGAETPHGFAMSGYTPIVAFAAAIKACGSTETDKVIAAMEGLNFESLSGPCAYRKEDHQLISRSYIASWEPTDAAPGFKAREYAVIEDADIVNPPAPGGKSPD